MQRSTRIRWKVEHMRNDWNGLRSASPPETSKFSWAKESYYKHHMRATRIVMSDMWWRPVNINEQQRIPRTIGSTHAPRRTSTSTQASPRRDLVLIGDRSISVERLVLSSLIIIGRDEKKTHLRYIIILKCTIFLLYKKCLNVWSSNNCRTLLSTNVLHTRAAPTRPSYLALLAGTFFLIIALVSSS